MPSNAYNYTMSIDLPNCVELRERERGRMTEVSRGRANAVTLHNIVCKSKNITRHDLSSSVPTRPGASSACVPVGGGWPWWLLDPAAMAHRPLGWGECRESQSEGDRRGREVYVNVWVCLWSQTFLATKETGVHVCASVCVWECACKHMCVCVCVCVCTGHSSYLDLSGLAQPHWLR